LGEGAEGFHARLKVSFDLDLEDRLQLLGKLQRVLGGSRQVALQALGNPPAPVLEENGVEHVASHGGTSHFWRKV
jgi:hypothetical protein